MHITYLYECLLPLSSYQPSSCILTNTHNRHAIDVSGVEILFNCRLEKLDVLEPGGLYCAPWGLRALAVTVGGERRILHAESILNATGRVPNVVGLGLEKVCLIRTVCTVCMYCMYACIHVSIYTST